MTDEQGKTAIDARTDLHQPIGQAAEERVRAFKVNPRMAHEFNPLSDSDGYRSRSVYN